jgi:L-alanine-DL-glutamate epimerase-like enolase superfamily enzyme
MPRLLDARCRTVAFPVISPQRMGVGTLTERAESVFIQLRGDGGVTGYGEVATWNVSRDYTPAEIEACLMEQALPALAGRDLDDPPALLAPLDAIAGHAGLKAGLEMAAYDACGRHLRRPLHDLLGGLVRPALRLSYSVSAQDLAHERELVGTCYDEGYRIFKVKCGILGVEADVARLETFAAIAPVAEIRVDFNEVADPIGFDRLVAAMRRIGMTTIEQPFPAAREHLLRPYTGSDLLFVADESCKSAEDLDRILDERLYGVVSLKLAKVGGFERATRMLARAAGAGVKGYAGGTSETIYGVTAAVHFFCTRQPLIDGCDFYFPFKILGPQAMTGGVRPCHGALAPPTTPGIACQLPDEWFS